MELILFKKIKQSIISDLKNSNEQIQIAVAWFTNHEFYDVLIKKLHQGVKVTLIIINDPINNRIGGLDWQNFIKCGGQLHFSFYPKIMHHKFCIIDDKIVYNGSFNWTYSADKINRENSIRYFQNTLVTEAFKHEFKELTLTLKNYKRVKPYSLEEYLEFQLDKAYRFYASKELNFNIKRLIYQKKYELADKVLSIADRANNFKKNSKSPAIREKIQASKIELEKKQLIHATIDKKISAVVKQKAKLNAIMAQPALLFEKTANSIKKTPNKAIIKELNKQEKLLKALKSDSPKGQSGSLRINLKWESIDDLDLHVLDPSNNHIYYSAKEAISDGSKGQLDVDANAGSEKIKNPQENIFWELDPPQGAYKIYVVHYNVNQLDEVPFIISIFTDKGASDIIFSKVHYTKLKSILVAEIEYEKTKGITRIKKLLIPSEI
jgi:uncharacterized protein YfaP (DUF2135 family)